MKNTINTYTGNEQTPEKKQDIKNLSAEVSQQLADLFGLNEEKLNKIKQEESVTVSNETKEETIKLADKMEVNSMEYELAKLLGKDKELLSLNNEPMSFAGVMKELEEYSLAA